MTAPLTDNQILSTLWNSLDRKPNGIFGVPAISLTALYSALNTTYERTDPNYLVSVIQPNTQKLLGSKHGVSLKSIRRGEREEKEYWIVFKPASSCSVSKSTSGNGEGHEGEDDHVHVKDIELLSDLPGGEQYQNEHGMSTRGIARDKAKSAKKKIFGVLGLKKETGARVTEDGSEDGTVAGDYEQDGVRGSNDIQEQVNFGEEYKSRSVGKYDSDRNQVRSQETDKGKQSERGADEDKNGMEEEDWLEQTQKWNKNHNQHQHQHDDRTEDKSKTISKPERKGTEWDIIDAYDYGSDGEDQDQDNANDVGSVEDKAEIKSEFDPSVLQKRPSTTRKQTLFENEEFHGKISEYYERFQDEPLNTEEVEGQDHENGVDSKGNKKGRKEGSKHSEKNRKDDGSKFDDQDEQGDGDDGEKSRETRDGHEKHRGDHKQRKHSNEEALDCGEGEGRHRHKSSHRQRHHSESDEDNIGKTHKHKHRHRSSANEKDDKDRKHRHKHEHRHHHKTKESKSEKRKDQPQPPTPFLIKSFKGLPFEPDTNFIDTISWMGNRWQLIVAELIAVLGTVYIIQATGL